MPAIARRQADMGKQMVQEARQLALDGLARTLQPESKPDIDQAFPEQLVDALFETIQGRLPNGAGRPDRRSAGKNGQMRLLPTWIVQGHSKVHLG